MPDLLSLGVSGLNVSQLALDTTGHNIANANTPGYSRQSVQVGTEPPMQFGSFWMGQGALVQGVRRSYSQFLNTALQTASTGQAQLTAYSDLASRLDNLMASSSGGVQPALDGFYGAIQDLANNPADVPTRQALLGKAQALAAQFQGLAGQFGQFQGEINQRLTGDVSQINGLAQGIASLNGQIVQMQGAGQAPNDLLDQRDALLQKLGGLVGVTAVPQDNGTLNVMVGNGQQLVLGTQASALKIVPNAYDPGRSEVALAGTGTVISGQLSGGEVSGLLTVRDQVVIPAQNQLGRAATALALAVNAQSHAGMDLHGNLGGDLFSVPAPTVLPSSANAGSASVAASVTGSAQLTAYDYTLRNTSSGWTLTRSDGTAVALAGAGTAASPFTADGLSLVVSGAAAVGDSFQIQPTRNAAAGFTLAIRDPSAIAAALPVRSSAASANTGNAGIGTPSVTNAGNPQLLSPVTISFTSPTTYQINGAGSYAYSSGGAIALNGWSVAISGTPVAGDSFSVTSNAGGVGDNGNALALGATASLGVLDGGATTVGQAYGQLVAGTGSLTQQSQTQLVSQTALVNQATSAQQSVSGVNLDEEAARLVRYQQSYQAAAHVIATAQTIFQSLLTAVGGA